MTIEKSIYVNRPPYNIMWYSNCEVMYMYFVYISLQGTCSGHHRCTVLIGIYLQIFALAILYLVTTEMSIQINYLPYMIVQKL